MAFQYSNDLVKAVRAAFSGGTLWDQTVRGAVERGDVHASQLVVIPTMMSPEAICQAFADGRSEEVLMVAGEIVLKTSLRNRCCVEAAGG